MALSETDLSVSAESTYTSGFSLFHMRANDLWQKVEKLSQWLDKRSKLLAAFIFAFYLLWAFAICVNKPLWHDELFTYNLGNSPNLGQLLQDVPKADLNPPVLYVLEYFSLRIPGALSGGHAENLLARLPSILGGLIASLGLFAFVRPRNGALYATASVALLWASGFSSYIGEDRPYTLLLGFMMLLVLAWEQAGRPNRSFLWPVVILLLGLAMMGSHFMAVFVLVAFVAGEAVREWDQKRLDLPVLFSLCVPYVIPVIYSRVITGYENMVFPPSFQPGLSSLSSLWGLLSKDLLVLALAQVISLLATRVPAGQQQDATEDLSNGGFSRAGWAFLLVLMMEPALSMLSLARRHAAFFPRYGLPGIVPVIVIVTWFLFQQFKGVRRVALITISFALLSCGAHMFKLLALRPPIQAGGANSYTLVEPDLPLVTDSGLTYVEMNHREAPAVLQRLYYLTDKDAAIQYAHATLFEWEASASFPIFHFQSHVEPLQKFTAAHPKFLVLGDYDSPENWLLHKLMADGDTLRLLGHYSTGYTSTQLYEVTVNPSR